MNLNKPVKNNKDFISLAKELFPINRSLTGPGNLKTLKILKKQSSILKIKSVNTGYKCFDWKVPLEWSVNDAYIIDPDGKKICDLKENNLHLVGYSTKFFGKLKYNQLIKKLHYLKDKPDAIPYVTSYYKKNWGFCISYNKFKKLKKRGYYKIFIDSKLKKGKMLYAEGLVKGKSKKEILITSYICHPSMANNELSGPLVLTKLANLLKPGKFTIRLLLIPETIGAIFYIKKNFKNLKKNLISGINLSCVGDNGPYTIISTLNNNTYIDLIANRILNKRKNTFKYSYDYRGSNERQFGCQNLNFPFITFCRSRFMDYPEYHTSDDNLKIISNKNLLQSLKFIIDIIKEIQSNRQFRKKIICEPFLTKYKLINTTSKSGNNYNNLVSKILPYINTNYDMKFLQEKFSLNKKKINLIINLLKKNKIIEEII